jgi:amidohydrolase
LDIRKASRAIQQDVINWRRKLHQIPEIGFDLPKTSRFVRECLEDFGIPYRTAARTGIVAFIEGGMPGPTLALRADMDALPVREATDLTFASKNGNMHACGHDAHMAILLGAAKIINGLRGSLKGNVKLLFQPGEEGHGGAAGMIANGCLENPPVDAVVGLHVGQIFPEVKTGQIGICEGPILAAATAFNVTVHGKSTHGALPHLGVDAITVAAEMVLALQKIISREVNPLDPAVLTIGKISGGEALNIVTSKVVFNGDFRTITERNKRFISRRIKDICKLTAKANRAEAEASILDGYPPTQNDADITRRVIAAAVEIIGVENVVAIKKPGLVTEDMSLYLEKAPGAFFVLGTGNSKKGIIHPHHSPRFDVDEEVLWIGAAVFVQMVRDYLASE